VLLPVLAMPSKNFVPLDTFVVATGDFGGIDKGDPGTFAETDDIKKEHHRDKNTMLDFNKSIV